VNLTHFAVSACMICFLAGAALAQDRMPPIPANQMTDAQKKAAEELTSGPRKTLVGPFIPLLRSPELMDRLQKMGAYLRYQNSIGHRLTEFVILYTARQWTQQFEWYSHVELAQKAGVEPDVIAAIRDGRRPAAMTEDEEIAYDFCSELYQHKSVSDATYARAVKKFGEHGVIDLTSLTGYYSMLGMILNVARTPLPPGQAPGLASFPH
jgi:4-carboxymuconolactone decarboxylase